jgi:hypothetical protein
MARVESAGAAAAITDRMVWEGTTVTTSSASSRAESMSPVTVKVSGKGRPGR